VKPDGPSGDWTVTGALLMVSLVGASTLLIATPFGLGVTDDSHVYLSGARHLQAGRGFLSKSVCTGAVVPISHFPPFYSVVLSLSGLFEAKPLEAARWLNAALLGANSLIVGLLLHHLLPSARIVPLLGAFLTATSLVMLEVHSAVWTEPLFIFLMLLGLICLGKHLAAPDLRLLVVGSLFVGLAASTRYAGIALVLAGGLGLLLWCDRTLYRRLLHAASFGLISCLPLGLVMLRNLHQAGSATDRSLSFHPVTGARLEALIVSFGSWLLPGTDRVEVLPFQDEIQFVVVAVMVVFLITGTLVLFTKTEARETNPMLLPGLKLFVLYVLTHVALLFAAGSVLDNRMLSLIFLPLLVLSLCAAWAIYHRSTRRWVRSLLVVAGVGLSSAYLAADGIALNYLSQNGRGYLGPQWDYSAIWAELSARPEEVPIYTNYPLPVTLHTGRRACSIKRLFQGDGSALADALEHIGAGRADVVIFDSARRLVPRKPGALGSRPASPSQVKEFLERSGGSLIMRERNAAYYGLRD